MTPINYPATLPCFRWEPYSVAPRPGSLEETLGMITNLSRVYAANNEAIACELVLNATTEPIFRNFWKVTTAMGTQWWNGQMWRNSAYADVELLFIGPPPVFTPIAHNVVRASFNLLTRGEPFADVVYELTATNIVNIPSNEFAEAALKPTSPAGTVYTISTLSTDRLVIHKPSIADDPRLDWDAWSPYDENDDNGGATWGNWFTVSNEDDEEVYEFLAGLVPTIPGGLAALQAVDPITLSGHTSYTFWGWDIDISDNRRGLSLLVETYSRVV